MRKHWKILAAICVIVAAISYAYPFRLYYIREDGGGQVLWNANEAYLFMEVVRRGYQVSYSEYPLAVLSEWLGGVQRPTGQRVFLWVIHVTPSGVERHLAWVQTETGGVPHSFTPMGDSIFTFCNGVLCKWSDNQFIKATANEEKEIGGIEHLSRDLDGPINGWTKRGIGAVSGDVQFSAQVGAGLTVRVMQGNVYKSTTATVVIERSGQRAQEVWHLNGSPQRIGKREYDREFIENDTHSIWMGTQRHSLP